MKAAWSRLVRDARDRFARGCGMLLTTDEEIGSPVFRPVIERVAAGAGGPGARSERGRGTEDRSEGDQHLPGADHPAGGARRARTAQGHQTHCLELADQVRDIAALGSGELTVTPTLAHAGTTTNTVPAEALVHVDVRVPTKADQQPCTRGCAG